ncbi:MAG: arginine deiminase-related protein [Lysobacteraceae bacterium]
MLLHDASDFLTGARKLPADRPACADAVFLVRPDGFALAEQSASDNRYMAGASAFDAERALAQHAALTDALREELPVTVFPGSAHTPDAVFPNNVFGSAPGRLVLGHMRHAVRQREAEREDIRAHFIANGCTLRDLRQQPGIAELTGALIIDRARGIGLAGYSERCDEAGAVAMLDAFDLRLGYGFALANGEYHSNVVMSVLASRALVICPDAFVDPAAPATLSDFYAPQVIELSVAEKNAFAGNCIALRPDSVWMSEAAADALMPGSRSGLEKAGFRIRSVALDAIEKAGGSLRCCVGEVFSRH